MSEYFEKRDEFQKNMDEIIPAFLKSMCKLCPSQKDQHQMNCIECCPLKRTIEDIYSADLVWNAEKAAKEKQNDNK